MQHHLCKWYCEINVVLLLSVPNARSKFVAASLVYVRGKSSVEITCLWQKIENQKQNKTLENNLAFD